MKFEPPEEQDVAEYMVLTHDVLPDVAVVQAKAFHGYWESRGWARGKEPMKSWKGSVATWVSRFTPDMLSGNGRLKWAARIEHLRELAKEKKNG